MTDNLSLKVKEIWPYYYDLEEKFLEQAGIKPSATSDEIFCESDDNDVFHIEVNNGEGSEEGKKSDSDVVNIQMTAKMVKVPGTKLPLMEAKKSHLLG